MAEEFSIVLLRPEIPHNTGAIGRLCVGLGVKLNLVRPLGFQLDDKAVARAGLDYWPHLEKAIHDTWEDYLAAERPKRVFFLSTHGEKSLYDIVFEPGDALVFGNEGLAYLAPVLGANGDVLEVRVGRAEPAGAGQGLVEGGMDPGVKG